MQVIDYKCPNCGGDMAFDNKTGMLACHSCGRTDNIEGIADPLTLTQNQNTFSEDEATEYHCKSCGAVVMTEPETTATACSFCGSNLVLGDRLTGKLAPAYVIPFSIGKDDAMKAFRKWCRNGRLTPNGFMTADRVKGITGMYVPFWLYDLDNQIHAQARATKVRNYKQGDYLYTETQHFDVHRKIRLNYVKVPIDASEKMNDQLMDRLEPFPYDKLKSFKSPYLAGYIAEKYRYNDEELFPRAQEKIREFIDSYIRSTMSEYTTVNVTDKQVDTTIHQVDYVLLPVWVVHYDYKKTEHTFAMNGQTGKVVGKPPISKAKVAAWFASISAASFLSLKLVSWMMGGGLW
ncbi:TFIIB-type zinc ribbon-containing protein [Paenibacillus ginsengarvi]|uniref:TFIIB-type zinc ribbon-containing protein n=1 Tax=Paenibacillus ginsengarvi TaxID=400777 RepID=A0A3B0CMH4_9BACL|nr:TFIIB-type zinc ribbon-containing protein [Paenibacillus ginsengarvi]RKN86071.1 TFIIB-type zinc ribbon-containing protein [Paenibacillus ginsengarvi]